MIHEDVLKRIMLELAETATSTETAFFLIAKDQGGDGRWCVFASTHEGPWSAMLHQVAFLYAASETRRPVSGVGPPTTNKRSN